MTSWGENHDHGNPAPRPAGGAERRAVIYCLLPPELAPKLHDLLRRHFADQVDVEVVIERREGERRAGADRRVAERPRRRGAERRQGGGPMGRRVGGERRERQVPLEQPLELPRRARRYAQQVAFVERLEPSTEEAEDRDTARVIARVQAGDSEAFSGLYSRYFDRVYSYLRVALRDHHDAEDGTQQVFMQVLEKLPAYEQRGRPFRNWLFAIARNYAISELRKSGRIEYMDQEQLDRQLESQGAQEATEPLLEGFDWLTDRDLMLFVERLPLPQRQVLFLRYMVDLPYAEVAQVLGRSLEDVKTLHHRAVGFLRKRFEAIGRTSASGKRTSSSYWPVFSQMEVLRHRRFMLH